ncbi:coactosin [Anaeramoeba flamelloides]|uniref:Coactosin n=1 Tax=Anaeramoeba flamelloides TaxID=1746091 RepID=A0ABQ8ZDT4_9EUKA|nr:coactosin [Anaeramoeba flamelloides]
MSIEFIERNTIRDAIEQVRDDKNPNMWVMLGFEGNENWRKCSFNQVSLTGYGEDFNDLLNILTPTTVGFILVGIEDIYDNIPTYRFCYIYYLGDKVPLISRGRIGMKKQEIERFLGKYNVSLEYGEPSEVELETIKNKVADASGSRVRIVENNEISEDRKISSFHSTHSKTALKASTNKKKESVVYQPKRNQKQKFTTSNKNVQESQLRFLDLEDIKFAITDVRNDKSSTDFMCIGYSGYKSENEIREIKLIAAGEGGIEGIKDSIRDTSANYAIVRVSHKIDETLAVYFVAIYWMGNGVNPLWKGKIATHRGAIDSLFEPVHLTIMANDEEDFDLQVIKKKIADISGTSNRGFSKK